MNPLTHWNNAIWLYQWLNTEPDTAHCILMAFIPIVARNVPLAKPENFKWVKLKKSLTDALTVMPELGRIVAVNFLTEFTLRQILGDSVYSKDASPSPPLHKKSRAYGEFQQEVSDDPV